jgi:hypothetical protein
MYCAHAVRKVEFRCLRSNPNTLPYSSSCLHRAACLKSQLNFYPDSYAVVKKNAELRSPWFRPRSSQLCVMLHYYTGTAAVRGSTAADLYVEYEGRDSRTWVKTLKLSKVSVI